MPSRQVWLLVCFKVVGQALISGTLISYIFVFSFFGSFASAIAMFVCYKLFYRLHFISNVGLSLCGSLCNNGAQIVCARYLLFGQNAKYIAPVLLLSGSITGIFLGLFVNSFEEKSVWFKAFCGKTVQKPECYPVKQQNIHSFSTDSDKKKETVEKTGAFTYISIATGVVFFILLLCARHIFLRWIFVSILFFAACIARKKRVKVLPSLLITVSVTFFCLISPFGRVLFRIGSWALTEGALSEGLKKSSTLVGMVFFSQCILSAHFTLPGKMGHFFSEVFSFFGKLHTQSGFLLQSKHISQNLDTMLCSVYETCSETFKTYLK